MRSTRTVVVDDDTHLLLKEFRDALSGELGRNVTLNEIIKSSVAESRKAHERKSIQDADFISSIPSSSYTDGLRI